MATGNGISGGTITSTGTLTVGAGNGLSQSSTGLLMSGSYTGNFSATGDITADQFISTNNGNGQNYRIGDDVWLGDINVANTVRISGNQDATKGFITFGSSSNTTLGRSGTGDLIWGGDFQTTGDITVSGGDITLGGTGRIQGIDTVSSGTDAANKTYVDNAVAGVPQGDITNVGTTSPITGGGSSGSVTISHANSGVTAGSYTRATVTVNATGHVTSISANSDAQGVTSVATGNGISGGTITSTGTLTVGAGDGLSQSSTGLLVDSTVVRTSGTQTIAGAKTFSNDLTMANTADLKFVDLAGTFPTSGKGFDWTLNNDGARIYAIQPSSDSIDLTFELRDNATTNDRFVFFVNDYQGSSFDKYPLIIRGGTQFDLVDSALYTNGTIRLSNAGALTVTSGTFSGDVTVNGGDITLGGTGRIQGIDTVSAGTDAANKTYVDTAVAGAGSGTFLPLAGGTMTGLVTDLELANDLVTGKTGVGNIYAKDSNNTFWQVFKANGGTFMTASGTSSDSITLGAPTSSVTTNLTVSGDLQTGTTGDGSLTLKQSGTTFMQMFKVSSSAGSFINTGTGGDTIHFGNTTGLVCNVDVTGFLNADNFKINGYQGTNGQVLTSSGSGVSWQTPTSGTVTGSGSANKLAVWTTGANIVNTKITDISNSGFYALDNYTATAVSTTGPIDPNQNAQAASQDTLATLSVDPTGNIVRGEQEATFTFTLAQLNTTLGQTLISAPGAGKAVVITYTDWMMKYSSTGSVNNQLEIRQANLAQANASVSVLPALRFNEIVNQSQSGSAPFYGFYTRDIPTGSGSQGRTYAVNKATTFHKQTSSPYPSGLTSISIKIRYRIFDVSTF